MSEPEEWMKFMNEREKRKAITFEYQQEKENWNEADWLHQKGNAFLYEEN